MVRLFNQNLPSIIGNSIIQAGGLEAGILRKVSYTTQTDPNDRTPVYANHPFQGTLRTRRRNRNGVTQTGMQVKILANTLPRGIRPEPEDKITMRGYTLTIIDVSAGASETSFTCMVRT